MTKTRRMIKSGQSAVVRFIKKHKDIQATLWAHFSQGVAKLDTLPTNYKLLIIFDAYVYAQLSSLWCPMFFNTASI